MNAIAIVFLAISASALLMVPRRWAPLALLVGVCYVTRAQGIELGPFSFTVVRILIAIGMLRVVLRGELMKAGVHGLDRLILAWGAWMVLSVAFHSDPLDQVVERLGLVFDACGAYILIRCFCRTQEELWGVCRMTGIVLAPIAGLMVAEKLSAHNFFAFLGGVPETPQIRNGHVRAQGPFGHAILAGTIGAVCLPLVLSVWRLHRTATIMGAVACGLMVFASSSSGPILSAAAGLGALAWWRFRRRNSHLRWAVVGVYVFLALVMKSPPYYLLARIDLAGGSTGWHRARLIEVSIQQISEWWLAGTDYTRHWMASGVSWSPNHTDITNHYLQMGVLGGLPLMILFIAVVTMSFRYVGRGMQVTSEKMQFALWALGASLFSHAVTCISVSYFDQSAFFLYLTLGLIGAAHSVVLTDVAAEPSKQPARPQMPTRGFSAPRPAFLPAAPKDTAQRGPAGVTLHGLRPRHLRGNFPVNSKVGPARKRGYRA